MGGPSRKPEGIPPSGFDGEKGICDPRKVLDSVRIREPPHEGLLHKLGQRVQPMGLPAGRLDETGEKQMAKRSLQGLGSVDRLDLN